MKKIMFLSIILAITCTLYTPFLEASCPLGTITSIDTDLLGSIPNFTAYSPLINGSVFAATPNQGDNTISVFQVNNSTGTLMEVIGSPFASGGTGPFNIAFSPVVGEQLFAAIINKTSNNVSIFRVDVNTGFLTQVSGSPFAVGSSPYGVAFSPLVNGNVYLAVSNNGANTMSIFQLNLVTGALTTVSGSPFTAGSSPYGVAFSPLVNNNVFLVAAINNTVPDGSGYSMYKLDTTTNAFSFVGTQTIPSNRPISVAFSPVLSNKVYLATGFSPLSLLNIQQLNTSTGILTSVGDYTGSAGLDIKYSPVVNGNLFIATTSYTSSLNEIRIFKVNTTDGSASQITGSPFTSTGLNPVGVSYSPILSGGLFLAITNQTTNNISSYSVSTLIPTLTTLSQYISNGSSIAINGTINGGTAPYTITWQDSTVQSGINTSTFSRTVSPTSSTIYYVATITDANGCSAGPSNSVAIAVQS